MKLDLHRTTATDAHPYRRRARATMLPAVVIGVVGALLLTPATGIALAYATAYVGNSAAIGDGLTRLRVAAERRLPRTSKVAHTVGPGRLPWLGMWVTAFVASMFFAAAGIGAVAAVAGTIAVVAALPALAQAATRSYRSAVLAKDVRLNRAAAKAPESAQPSAPEPVVHAPTSLGRPAPIGLPPRTVAALAARPVHARGHGGLGD